MEFDWDMWFIVKAKNITLRLLLSTAINMSHLLNNRTLPNT